MNQDVLKQKEAVVSEVTDLMKNSKAVVVCEYRGLTVADITSLRKELRNKNAKANVYKNSLVTRAVNSLDHKDFDTFLSGPNLFIFMDDYSNGSLKFVAKFAKKHESFQIKGGIIEGKVSDADTVKAISLFKSPINKIGFPAAIILYDFEGTPRPYIPSANVTIAKSQLFNTIFWSFLLYCPPKIILFIALS